MRRREQLVVPASFATFKVHFQGLGSNWFLMLDAIVRPNSAPASGINLPGISSVALTVVNPFHIS